MEFGLTLSERAVGDDDSGVVGAGAGGIREWIHSEMRFFASWGKEVKRAPAFFPEALFHTMAAGASMRWSEPGN